ncbi:hypothetical protein ACEWY4_020827 [Coilia grayii]|uniref:Uncharacterized protein n=1 Tax=Coilia grayii TaxID=363190 RepID=A0ABD1J7K6_9TELE
MAQQCWNGWGRGENSGQRPWNSLVNMGNSGQQLWNGRGRRGNSGHQRWNGRGRRGNYGHQRWNGRGRRRNYGHQRWNGRRRRGNSVQQPWNGRGRRVNFCQQLWNGRADRESRVQRRRNDRGIRESYVQGVHMSIDQLKTKDLHHKDYITRNVSKPSEVPYRFSVPHYPHPVEFHTYRVAHVTTKDGMHGILDSGGFKGGQRSGFLCWGLVIGPEDIAAAEQRYLEKLFPARTPWEKSRQMPFLHNFTTSPVFKDGSRYGNFRFSFSLPDVLQAYSTQFCGGKEPVLRVWETIVYKQEVMYTVLVHSPDVHDYDGFPVLGHNDNMCAYQNSEIMWHAQAISKTHKFRLIKNRDEKQVSAESVQVNVYYVWDHVTLNFHIPKSRVLSFPLEKLHDCLTACRNEHPGLNKLIGYKRAKKIVDKKKAITWAHLL